MTTQEKAASGELAAATRTAAKSYMSDPHCTAFPRALSSLLDQATHHVEHAQEQVERWRALAWRHRRVKGELELLAALREVQQNEPEPPWTVYLLFRPDPRRRP